MIYNQVDIARMREYQAPARLFEKKIYFSSQNAAANDVFQVIPTKANDIVLAAWVEVVTACDTDAAIDLGYGTAPNIFGNHLVVDTVGKCDHILKGTLTWDAYLIYAKSENTNELRIRGVRYGDHVSVSPNMDCADMSLTAEVIHPDWVAVHLVNNTDGGLDLAEQDIEVVVDKAPQMGSPLFFSAGDTIDVTANTAITQGVIKVSAVIIRK